MIKGVNLIPEDVKRGWLYAKVRKGVYAAFVLYGAVLAFVFVSQRTVLAERRSEATAVERTRAELLSRRGDYAALRDKYESISGAEEEIKKRLAVAAGISDSTVPWAGLLKRLSHDVPGRVWLRSLSTSDGDSPGSKKVRFLGSSMTNRAVADMIFTIENSGYFTDVTLAYTQKRDFDSKTLYDFEISAVLVKGAGDD